MFTIESNNTIPDKGPSSYPVITPLEISLPGVKKPLNNINLHKATGADNISGRILKELKDQTAPILTLIFKTSLETGITPTDWKHANVAPVFKKGGKYKPENYRPISLTCISCKLMEHIITKHIINHLEKNNILYDFQHGFRQSRSCETQLISFIQELAANNNNNTQIYLIIMDFAKAFDKVPHKRLLYKLNFYCIQNETLNWVYAFLNDKTRTVVLDRDSSDLAPVTSGVPQGTVLGPVLFFVYINDLPEYLSSSKLKLFADDSIIYKINRRKHSNVPSRSAGHYPGNKDHCYDFNPIHQNLSRHSHDCYSTRRNGLTFLECYGTHLTVGLLGQPLRTTSDP